MPAYWAAVVLDPGKRLKALARSDPVLASKVKSSLIAYFERHYPSSVIQNTNNYVRNQQSRPPPKKQKRVPVATSFDSPDTDDDELDDDLSEVEKYLTMKKTSFFPGQDPIEWWRQRRDVFPRLSQMAFDILSIPAMSDEPERVFSQSKLTITSQRQSISTARLEALQCIKSWSWTRQMWLENLESASAGAE